ncbi:Os12g0196800 [Oryza sativa Japonica Group]|nr:Os12g0196800 [Oryza sativa Japonica Group]
MQECLSMFFLDWTDEVTNVDSGINSLVYMKNWMASNVSEVSINNIRADIVMDIMAMKDNTATLPDVVRQLMKQYNSAVSQ